MTAPRRLLAALAGTLGGPERARVIGLLAAVLALSFADTATVGAVATELKRSLRISNTELGLLPAATAFVGVLITLPAGVLADRVGRVRLLAVAVALWGVASLASAAALSYSMLLATRIGLGLAVAVAGPVIASLTGDLFPPEERARVYGWILTGEFLGAGVGFALGGSLGGALGWRAAFAWLALPGGALAWALVRWLPEPARGGADRLAAQGREDDEEEDLLHAQIRERDIEAEPERVPAGQVGELSLPRAIRWILSIPSNRLLIVSSALGYFFFAGVQTFAVVLLRHRFGLGQAEASGLLLFVGSSSIVGVLVGGRLADAWTARGRLDARVTVPAAAYLVAAALLVPALLVTGLALALPFFVLAVGVLGMANPPLDAARLDVVPGRLWGRGEAARTLLRQLATAGAPIAFGASADLLGGGGGGALAGARGVTGDIRDTFLLMLLALVAAGLILLRARRSFPQDVATAAAAEGAMAPAGSG